MNMDKDSINDDSENKDDYMFSIDEDDVTHETVEVIIIIIIGLTSVFHASTGWTVPRNQAFPPHPILCPLPFQTKQAHITIKEINRQKV